MGWFRKIIDKQDREFGVTGVKSFTLQKPDNKSKEKYMEDLKIENKKTLRFVIVVFGGLLLYSLIS